MRNSRGFTILEVLVAVFLLTLGVGGALTLTNQTSAASQTAASRLVASYLAQEGIEVARSIRDSNFLKLHQGQGGVAWNDGLPEGVQYLNYNRETAGTPNLVVWENGSYVLYSEPNCQYYLVQCRDTVFNRQIEISYPEGGVIKIKSVVSWQERGRPHQVFTEELLYNWWQQ